jgi:hypothetical protein
MGALYQSSIKEMLHLPSLYIETTDFSTFVVANFILEFFSVVFWNIYSLKYLILPVFTPIRLSNKRATRARISMMPVGTPRVPYRTPGEGTWQWLDIWNALVRHHNT